MKRIAVICETWFPYLGGGQTNAYEISKRIAGKKYAMDIITRNCGRDQLPTPKNLRIIKLGRKQDPLNLFSKIMFLLRSGIYIYKSDYDLVHAHAFLPGITARIISVFKGTPSVFTVHGTSLNSGLNHKFKELLEKWILTGILYDTQITVSRDFYNFKNVNKKIVFIANGVNAKRVNNKNHRGQSLLFVGRLHKQKNVATLFEALPAIMDKFPGVVLTVIGEGAEKEKLKDLCAKLKLSKHVKFWGNIENDKLAKYYQAAALLVLPSIYEGEPLVLLEAWANKLPVVATATGDCPFLVKEGHNGFLIKDPLNASEIARVVTKALGVVNLSKLGQNGYNFVYKNFTWAISAKQTKDVYQNLLKAKN